MPPKEKNIETSDVTKPKKSKVVVARQQSSFPITGIDTSAGDLEALRESEERNNLFQRILQSSSDGILAVNRENEVIFSNERFVEMWMIPQELMATKNDTLLLQYVLDQLSDPQSFLKIAQELYNSAEESFDTLYFKDGRVFERLSRPLLDGTEVRGRVWSFRDITRRKRAEEALRESEERFRTILDNIEDGYYEVDTAGNFTFVNPALARILERPANELMGMNNRLYMTPEGAKKVFQTFNRVFRTGIPEQALDWDLVRPDGTRRPIETSVSLIKAGDGSIQGFRGTVHDITERKWAEEALHQSEERYQIVADFTYSWELWVLPNGSLAYISPSCEHLTGYPARAFLKDPGLLLKIIHPEDQVLYADHIEKTNSHPEYQSLDYRILHRDGHVVWISHSCSAVSDANGQPLGRRVSNRDITERKQAEDALHESEAELRALFASMQDAVLVIDRDGVYRKIAPTNPGLLVRPPEELLGKNLRDVFPAEKAESFIGIIQRVLETRQIARIEYELPIGERLIWFATSISPMEEDSTLWVARDITERKKIDESLRESESNQRMILDNVDEIVYWTEQVAPNSPEGVPRFVSNRAEKILGYHPREFLENPGLWFSLIHSDDIPAMGKQTAAIFASRRPGAREYRIRSKHSDEYLWMEDLVVPRLDTNGNVIGTFGVARDITERKQTEESLRESEDRYRDLVENSQDLICTHDLEGRILSANPWSAKLLGYDMDALLQMNIRDILAPEVRGGIEAYLAKIRKHDAAKGLLLIQTATGERRIWEYNNTLRTEGVAVPIVRGMAHDITERKQAEKELLRAKNALETAHRELQQSLAHEQVLARTDDLTGLCNRRQFFELAAREFTAAVRYQRSFSILMFDADDFKKVNDIFGHTEGDKALAQIAHLAAAQVRSVDVLARYGGDEFVLLLPQADAQQALLIAERIRARMAATAHMGADQSPFTVTLSIGIAELQRSPMDEKVERVIQRADEALYKAKQSGRNRIVIFSRDETGAI